MDVIIFDGIRPVLDVLIHIASYDEETWIKLYLYDDEFHSYARTNIGINKCIQSFWKTMDTIDLPIYKNSSRSWNLVGIFWRGKSSIVGEKVRTIFGKLHSFYDEPSVISIYGDMAWHKNGVNHRDNNMPAIIYANGEIEWWINGMRYVYDDTNAQK
jgi:hypothetical protein